MKPLRTAPSDWRYRALIGVGGIGSGAFFALNGNHTLGREESRSGRLLDRRDYCKLHIISHYVQTLLGPEFTSILVGGVGDDAVGRTLLEEMRATSLDVRYVRRLPGEQTLYSFCFVYPDGSGGNLTTDESASAKVDGEAVREVEPELARLAGRGVALAAPEVPLEARATLLELATSHRLFRVASFTSEEMAAAIRTGLLERVDLLAINADEAAVASGVSGAGVPPLEVVEAAVGKLRDVNSRLIIAITAGRDGSWTWDGRALTHVPAMPVRSVGTAGAGDAYLSGLIVGLVADLGVSDAQQLGTLVAALSVTSPHTINKDVNRESLRGLAEASEVALSSRVWGLLRA